MQRGSVAAAALVFIAGLAVGRIAGLDWAMIALLFLAGLLGLFATALPRP